MSTMIIQVPSTSSQTHFTPISEKEPANCLQLQGRGQPYRMLLNCYLQNSVVVALL